MLKLSSEAESALENAKQRLREIVGEKLGVGHGRIVYDDAGDALKIARRPEGLIQNKTEVELSGRSPYLNRVIAHAPVFSWVKQAKLESFGLGDEPELAQRLGLQPENEIWFREMIEGRLPQRMTPQATEFYSRFQMIMRDVPELDKRDLGKAAQWGFDAQGRSFLLDYGFTTAMPLSVAGLATWTAVEKGETRY